MNRLCNEIWNFQKELIISNGFHYEEYRIKTEDGYRIRCHRIVTGKTRPRPRTGRPVLFQIGLIMASDSWLLNGRKIDLAFQLADAGFDVWLADRRGNWYSREHSEYSQKSREFWNFSFHESGYYDLPAIIDRIIKITKYQQIIFVGHSMGCTEFFVMASLRPEYNARIKAAILLAPAAISPIKHEFKYLVLKVLIYISDAIFESLTDVGGYEMIPRDLQIIETLRKCCITSDARKFCLDIFGWIFGDNRANLNEVCISKVHFFFSRLKTSCIQWIRYFPVVYWLFKVES
ncbi:hypothetical protein O3M35_010088 [Rhynocoris fuscipes]|uniref:AB hydrolase-1 domain-containing protein n=1 Tax=Rhynocoris fuscipes TaxID=488301 RepID=A0AAW1CZY1_9HEMI